MVSGKLTPSQSHGGVLYYLVEVPKEEYEKSKLERTRSYSTSECNIETVRQQEPGKPRLDR